MTKETLSAMSDQEIESTKAFLKNSWKHSDHTEEFEVAFKEQLALLNEEITDNRGKCEVREIALEQLTLNQ